MPKAEFAFPGPLRDALVAAILDGTKSSTTSLFDAYALLGEEVPAVGLRQAVVDSADEEVAVIETTEVRIVPVAEVDEAHARDEGEGYTSVAEWRAGHEEFWHSAEVREEMGDPAFTVGDATLLVLQRFRLVERTAEDATADDVTAEA
ncbi:ASCH domain-containing protein [Kitasatospora sp. NPDC059571]|uniref:ASCH domain-containing protein n=1 Tax=Kitasatospora sp. NPDC059571 TaxID=3346871 RepID=UPI0036BC6180